MNEEIQIRKIKESDALSITELSNELGYKVGQIIVHEQIVSIINNNDHFAMVVEQNNVIIGYIHAFRALRLTTTPFLEICGLVVKEKYRKMGIGKSMVRHIEEHVMHVKAIRVRCNITRKSTHQFYENLAYSEKKKQKIFEKTLRR